jgi:WD40 repeat protein
MMEKKKFKFLWVVIPAAILTCVCISAGVLFLGSRQFLTQKVNTWVRSIDWSKDDSLLVAGSSSRCLTIWDSEEGKEIRSISDFPGFVRSVEISPDGQIMATGDDNRGIELWNVETGKHYHDKAFGAPLGYLAWSADGTQLAFTDKDFIITIVDKKTLKTVSSLKGKHTNLITGIVWSPDGSRIASSSADGTVVIWDVENAKPIYQLSGQKGWVDDLDWSGDGKTIASSGDDGNIFLWDAKTGKMIQQMKEHFTAIYAVAWSPNGDRLATAGIDNYVDLWDPQTGMVLSRLPGTTEDIHFLSLHWSTDGSRLAAGTDKDTILIWDLEKQELIHTLHMGCKSEEIFMLDRI